MFYYILQECAIGTAQMNRACANLKVLDSYSIDTTVVFLTPFSNGCELDVSTFSHIKTLYLYKEYPYFHNHLFEIIIRFIYPVLFLNRVKKGDTVYLYNCAVFMHYVLKKKGIRVFHERTEHPDCVWGNPITSLKKETYYQDCKKLDGLFVISTCLRDLFIEKGVKESRITIINMTVDESRFENLKKDCTEKYFAYCGVIFNNKDGVDQLIKAFSLISKDYADVKLMIIGPMPNNVDANGNMTLIRGLNIEDKVNITGSKKPEEVPQLLKNSIACVLARPDGLRSRAGFATKLGEYLLSGNPAIITNVGDFSLFLKDMDSALIVEPGNPQLLADKMRWVLDNTEEAKRIGSKGAEVARTHFNSTIETKKMIDIMFN